MAAASAVEEGVTAGFLYINIKSHKYIDGGGLGVLMLLASVFIMFIEALLEGCFLLN